ncbi:MAG: mechanosensitive ion channel [Microcoleaceae cyanobacterium]
MDFSQVLQNFVGNLLNYIPGFLSALMWIVIALLVATAVKSLVNKLLTKFGVDRTVSQSLHDPRLGETQNLSKTLAEVVYWFIILLFLPLILAPLGLTSALLPIQNLVDQILGALPKIIKAVIIAGVGWFVANTVRNLVENLMKASGSDNIGQKFGLSSTTTKSQSLSSIVGTLLYFVVLIPFVVASLQALEVQAISGPAIAMLNSIFGMIPQIFTAAIILLVAYYIGKFICDLVTNLLTGIGFNNIFSWLGLKIPEAKVTATPGQDGPSINQATLRTPSEIVGIVAFVGIMLFALVTATDILGLQVLTNIVQQILLVASQVLVAAAIFAVGLYLANFVYNLIASSGSRQARLVGQAARIGIIILVGAMALQQMGLDTDIINLAVGMTLGAIAVALSLAFGLGGRHVAGSQLQEWVDDFKKG